MCSAIKKQATKMDLCEHEALDLILWYILYIIIH